MSIKLSRQGWIALAAFTFAAAGLLSATVLVGRRPETTTVLILLAALAGWALGALGWAWLLRRNVPVSVWRGAAVGLLIGLAVYPVTIYLYVWLAFLSDRPMLFLEERVNPLEGLTLLPSLTLASWTGSGWMTGPAYALVDGALGYLHSHTLAETDPRSLGSRLLRVIGVGLMILGLVLLALGLVPVSTTGMTSRADPAQTYEAALLRLSEIQVEEDGLPLLPECRTTTMLHGQPTEKVIVLYHGLTNCPRQFVELGQQFFDLGYNVLIARFPHHVYVGRSPTDLSALSAEQYRDLADRSIDIARGLGRRIYVLGLSGGGTVAGWIAQNRGDVERVVLAAPFFGIAQFPVWLNLFFTNAFSRVPPIAVTAPVFLKHAIRGNNTRALSETMRLGVAVRDQLAAAPPLSKAIVLVINDNDSAVDNDMADLLFEAWQRSGATVERFAFPAALGLRHDLIDVQQPNQKSAVVYPVLIDLVEGRKPNLQAQTNGPVTPSATERARRQEHESAQLRDRLLV